MTQKRPHSTHIIYINVPTGGGRGLRGSHSSVYSCKAFDCIPWKQSLL